MCTKKKHLSCKVSHSVDVILLNSKLYSKFPNNKQLIHHFTKNHGCLIELERIPNMFLDIKIKIPVAIGIKSQRLFGCTPPKFNIAPEKSWWEDYFPIGKVTVQGRAVKLPGGISK